MGGHHSETLDTFHPRTVHPLSMTIDRSLFWYYTPTHIDVICPLEHIHIDLLVSNVPRSRPGVSVQSLSPFWLFYRQHNICLCWPHDWPICSPAHSTQPLDHDKPIANPIVFFPFSLSFCKLQSIWFLFWFYSEFNLFSLSHQARHTVYWNNTINLCSLWFWPGIAFDFWPCLHLKWNEHRGANNGPGSCLLAMFLWAWWCIETKDVLTCWWIEVCLRSNCFGKECSFGFRPTQKATARTVPTGRTRRRQERFGVGFPVFGVGLLWFVLTSVARTRILSWSFLSSLSPLSVHFDWIIKSSFKSSSWSSSSKTSAVDAYVARARVYVPFCQPLQ